MIEAGDAKAMDKAAAWWAAARANKYFRIGLLIALGVFLLDQASKYLIVHVIELPEQLRPCAKDPMRVCGQIALSPIFDLTYVENRGASFGLGAGGVVSRIILSLISTGVATGLAIWLGRLTRPVAVAGVSLIIGGAVGNLYDRVAYGYVVDFLDFSGLWFPWVFNVADTGINVGIGLLILDAWLTRDRGEEGKNS